MNFATLFNALPGACAQGLIWGIMAIGVYITYKILDLADLTVDGTMCTGGAVCHHFHVKRTFCGSVPVCGVYRGNDRGPCDRNLSHRAMGIPAILAGILTQLGLYSINLRIMGGKANQAISVDKYDLLVSLRYVKGVAFYRNTIFGDGIDHCDPDRGPLLVLRNRDRMLHPCHRFPIRTCHVPRASIPISQRS